MKTHTLRSVVLVVTTCLAADAAADPTNAAPAAGFGIGTPAPAIDVSHWIHPGVVRRVQRLTAFTPGTIYVLNFWATWCPYSCEAMPLLARLQRHYAKDVAVIGVGNDPLDSIQGFLADPDIDVREVAAQAFACCIVADLDGSIHESYLDPIREYGLPTTFVVGREGLIEWIGHPGDLEEPLRQVVAGTWDREAFSRKWQQLQASRLVIEDALLMIDAHRVDEAAAIFDRFVAANATNAFMLNEAAWHVVDRHEFKTIPDPLLAVAERAAVCATALSPEDGNMLDTLAHLQQLRGRVDEAIATERLAVARGGAHVERFTDYLKRLESLRP